MTNNELRTEYNMNLTVQWMFIPFLVVIIINILGLLYTAYAHYYKKQELMIDKSDFIILCLVFLAFLTEIAIIFILVMRYVYVSDLDIIIFIMNNVSLNIDIVYYNNLRIR